VLTFREDLYYRLADSISNAPGDADTGSAPRHYHERMDAYSRKILEETMRKHGWNQTKAAEELGLQRTYLTKLLQKRDVTSKPPGESSSEL
jgi:DNA-binding NtrC family response regulator